jgi:hypothetical protein
MEFNKKEIESLVSKQKKDLSALIIPMIIFPAAFIVFFLILQSSTDLDMNVALPIFGGIAVFFTLIFISVYSSKYKVVKDFEGKINEYVDQAKSVQIPEKPYEIDENSTFGVPYYVWFGLLKIYLFPKLPTFQNYKSLTDIKLLELYTSRIKYYYTSRDKYYENKISGGGSTGPNVAGAIVGEQIAGIGGAIVMGQSKTNPIESKLIVHDERRTVITYREEQGTITKYLLPFDFYEVLYEMIPELARDVIENPSRHAQVMSNLEQENNSNQVENKLKKLLDLKNQGLIDDQDYQEQKSKLLNKL